jgi:beta-glucanase (GH16 family)
MTRRRHRSVAALALAAACVVAHAGCSSEAPVAAVAPRGDASAAVTDAAPPTRPAVRVVTSELPGTPLTPPARPLCVLGGPPAATEGDTLVWADEFEGAAVDTSKWNVFDGEEEHSGILASFGPSNLVVEGGMLRVTTSAGSSVPGYGYTTGRMDTAHTFQRTFGRMDVRARFPIAPGVWYAIWSRQWQTPFPEIDIEVLGKATPEVWMVNHWAGGNLAPDDRRAYAKVPNVDPTVFHVYSAVWKPGSLEWRIDGEQVFFQTGRGVPTEPIQWTINAWVGGWGGTPTGATPFPTAFDIDWIRVYREGGLLAAPAIRVTRFDRHGGAPYNVPPYSKRSGALELEVANFDEACFHVEMREGDQVVDALDRPPFRFPLERMKVGPHVFTFVATDGVRSASVEARTYVE